MVAQRLKRLPAMWKTWVRSLGWEDPLEQELATHSSILAWRIPWTENPMDGEAWRATVHTVTKSQTGLSDFTFTLIISYIIGNLLICFYSSECIFQWLYAVKIMFTLIWISLANSSLDQKHFSSETAPQ